MATQSLYDIQASGTRAIRDHELFARLATGQLSRPEYLTYLREMHHLVKHTPVFLKIAAERVAHRDPHLRAFFLEFAADETGHELLCVHDIRMLGADPDEVLARPPGHGAWSMITQNYYLAAFGEPMALLGDTLATEVLGSELAGTAGDLLVERCGVASAATTFLRVHGQADIEHAERSLRLCEQYSATPAARTIITHACEMTLRAYRGLCDDVLACAPQAHAAIA